MEQNSSIFSFRIYRAPIIIVSIFILMEMGFRMFFFGPHTIVNWGKYNPRGILLTDIVMAVDNPEISWKLRPDVETIFKNQPFSTNALGLRNPEIEVQKAPEKTRVVVLGRSITMGAGVADDEVYTRVLQDKLDGWNADKYEIINCAVGGYSLKQMLNYYHEYCAGLRPDLVLIPLSKQDLLKSDAEFPPPLSLAKPALTNLSLYLGYSFTYESMRFVVKRSTKPHMSTDWKARAADITNPQPETASNVSILESFVAGLEAQGIRCAIFSPDRGEVVSTESNDILKQWASNHSGVDYLPINEYMQDRMPKRKHIYFGDNHPSPEVHTLFGQALFHQFETGVLAD